MTAAADEHIVMTGQSLARGPADVQTATAPYPSNVYRASSPGALIALAAETYETPAIGLAVAVHEERVTGTISTSVHAGGGLTYQQLKKGTALYEEAIDVCASPAVALVEAVHVVHGEKDTSDALPVATYEANLTTWQNDYDTDIKAATGQVSEVHMVISQTNSWPAYTATNGIANATIGLAQLAAHRNNPDITLACPTYQLASNVDGIHLTGAGSHHLGELMARAHTSVVDGAGWAPLMPLSVVRTGAVIVVTFDVPVAPLVLDTTIVPAQTHSGFTYHDDTDTAVISSVALGGGGTTVEITLNAVPTGANPHVGYGYEGTKYGNLRDSETAVSTLNATVLSNWCVHFYDPVTTP